MKLKFKFWGLTKIKYNKKLKKIYPFIYSAKGDLRGIAFARVNPKTQKYPEGIFPYSLKKIG